ncbi:hypothetical protein AAY473_029346 [Plecturocebus cupreus]
MQNLKVRADSVVETMTPKVLVNPVAEEFLSIMPPSPPQGLPAPGPEASASPPELHTPKSPRVDKRECRKTPPIAARFLEGTPPLAARLQPKAGVQMPLREQRYTGVDKDGHMVERRVFTYLRSPRLILSIGKVTTRLIPRNPKLSLIYCKLLFRLITQFGLIAISCLCIFLTQTKGGEYSKPLLTGCGTMFLQITRIPKNDQGQAVEDIVLDLTKLAHVPVQGPSSRAAASRPVSSLWLGPGSIAHQHSPPAGLRDTQKRPCEDSPASQEDSLHQTPSLRALILSFYPTEGVFQCSPDDISESLLKPLKQ